MANTFQKELKQDNKVLVQDSDKTEQEREKAAITIQRSFQKFQRAKNECHPDARDAEDFEPDPEIFNVGLKNYWCNVNHIAIVVSDIGISLSFYVNVIGMVQIIRPDFDRHGAWLTFGNLDLHLIKGKPAVHKDVDLIVGHIAVVVPLPKMEELRVRLQQLKYPSRRNVSVPNPAEGKSTGKVSQAFVRDPDGYYIEFCACEGLDDFLKQRMEDNKQAMATITSVMATRKLGDKLVCKT